MPRRLDLNGKRFGRLTATNNLSSRFGWLKRLCYCDCGKRRWVPTGSLISGVTKSCGCIRQRPSGYAARNVVLKRYKRHAIERNLSWQLSDDHFDELTQARCFYCNQLPVKRQRSKNGSFVYNGIDRRNNSLGYTKRNVVACCSICNHAKGTMTLSEFRHWVARLTGMVGKW
jgi:hypothetical protein